MANQVQKATVEQYEFTSLVVDESDFDDTVDTGDTIPAGTTREVMSFELSEDGEMSVYDVLRFGENPDGVTNESPEGKLFAELKNPSGNVIDKSARFRVISRPRNDDETTEHTGWIRHRNAQQDDPSKRLPLPPVTDDEGRPKIIKSNRIVAIEVRNPGGDVTVSRAKSEVELPAVAGY